MKFGGIMKLIKSGGEFIDEYGPQIAAIGSAICFVGGVIFAAKESPEAMEALEEKLDENPDMNIVEQGATVISRMPKTVTLTVGGLALHIFAWKKILGKVATLTMGVAALSKDNDHLVQAAKEVVGPDKATEIVERSEEIKVRDALMNDLTDEDRRTVMYPYTIQPFGITVWKTPDEFNKAWEMCVEMLASNEELSAYDMFVNFGSDESVLIECGWECETIGCGATAHDVLKWAKDELRYEIEMNNYRDKYPGYKITFINPPTAKH